MPLHMYSMMERKWSSEYLCILMVVEVWTRTHMYNYLATTLGVLIFQVWMCDVEDCMRLSLKELLRECRVDLRKHLAKRGRSGSCLAWTGDNFVSFLYSNLPVVVCVYR